MNALFPKVYRLTLKTKHQTRETTTSRRCNSSAHKGDSLQICLYEYWMEHTHHHRTRQSAALEYMYTQKYVISLNDDTAVQGIYEYKPKD